ncbi:MAG: hypothetical protein LAT84_14150 [Balneolia bacterium]|nr:hypothetical protein [Balneolia bacterium]
MMSFVTLFSILSGVLSLSFIFSDDEKRTIHLSKDLVINNEVLIGDFLTDIAAGEQGEIVVAMNDLAQVRVFSKDGELVQTFGQRGRGPGDFQNLMSVSLHSGLIYALDGGANSKINVFDPADPDAAIAIGLPPLRTETGINVVNDKMLIDDEQLLITYLPATSNNNIGMELTSSYYLVNTSHSEDKSLIFESPARERYVARSETGFVNTTMPFGRTNHVARLGNRLFHMWTGDAEIQVYDMESWNNVGSISVDELADPIALEENDYRQLYRERLGIDSEDELEDLSARAANDMGLQMSLVSVTSMIENRDKLHDTFPVYNRLLSCGNYLWITAPHADRSKQHIKQLDGDGNVLASGTLPSSVDVKEIKNGKLYGTDQDDDGFGTVVRYEIDIR